MIKKIPNILTASRIFISFLLLFLFVYFHELSEIYPVTVVNMILVAVFLLGAVTDFLDGYIARRIDEGVTFFGEVFDPLADKMLMLSAFLGLLSLDRAPLLAIFLILSREFFITGLRVIAVKKDIKVAASSLGKYKTASQIGALTFLTAGFEMIGLPLLWLAVVLTLYSGYDYAKAYMR